jgi:hypothetical protein
MRNNETYALENMAMLLRSQPQLLNQVFLVSHCELSSVSFCYLKSAWQFRIVKFDAGNKELWLILVERRNFQQ